MRYRFPLSVVVQCLGLMLTAGCASPAAPRSTALNCQAQVILNLHESLQGTDDAMLRQIAESQRLEFDSVMELGAHVYRILLRSDSEDCAAVIARLNRDARVNYATFDERKRPH